MFNITIQQLNYVFSNFNIKDYLYWLRDKDSAIYSSMFTSYRDSKSTSLLRRLLIGREEPEIIATTPEQIINNLNSYSLSIMYSNNPIYFYSRYKDYDFSLDCTESTMSLPELDYVAFMKMYKFVRGISE